MPRTISRIEPGIELPMEPMLMLDVIRSIAEDNSTVTADVPSRVRIPDDQARRLLPGANARTYPYNLLRGMLMRAVSRAWPLQVAVVLTGAVFGALLPSPAAAQAFNYPSLQLPTASTRDYTGAIVGGRGSTLLVQWRERLMAGTQFGLDAGLANPQARSSVLLFVAGSAGQEVLRASGDQPLDILATAGVGIALGGRTSVFRVPIGASIGHTFDLGETSAGMSVTPYVHPRLSLDICNSCTALNGRQTNVSVNFDLGANLQVNREFAVRAAGVFSGGNLLGTGDAFTVGFTWTPPALSTAGTARDPAK